MLVLTRKNGEELVIGDGIVVTVLSVQGNRVQLGINAPRSVSIRRGPVKLPAETEPAEPSHAMCDA